MCGRYASSRRPEDLVEEFEISETRINLPKGPLAADYNVAPTKEVYAVLERAPKPDPDTGEAASGKPERHLRSLRWGLVPSWAKDPSIGGRMINARMETVAEKPAFRRAFSSRRCLLPADGYFEWYPTQQTTKAGKPLKQPFFIRPKDGGILAMAGLYEIWRDPTRDDDDPERFRWTCTVLTTQAEDAVGHIHDRMPLMVDRARWGAWLDPDPDGRMPAQERLALLTPAAPGRLDAYPVATLVNNVRNNGPELLEPLPLDELPAGVEA
jgi:putative SOS response-associated peptidase YedK